MRQPSSIVRRYMELQGVLSGLAGGNFEIEQTTSIGEFSRFVRRALRRRTLLQPLRPILRSVRTRLDTLRGTEISLQLIELLRGPYPEPNSAPYVNAIDARFEGLHPSVANIVHQFSRQ